MTWEDVCGAETTINGLVYRCGLYSWHREAGRWHRALRRDHKRWPWRSASFDFDIAEQVPG